MQHPDAKTSFFSRVTAPFRRLAWKLTLSYTLVTVATLLVVELVMLGSIWFFVLASSTVPRQIIELLQQHAAPEVLPLLNRESPDYEELQSWLELFYTRGLEISPGTTLPITAYAGGSGSEAAIVDAEGRLLAAIPADQGTIGERFAPPRLEDVPAPLTAALAGEADPARLYLATPDNWYVMAVPVLDEESKVLGAIYFTSFYPALSGTGYFTSIVQGFMLPSLTVVTIAAALLGTLFGFLTARGLTRRLQALAHAADAWGQGDFSATVDSAATDEIGQLTRQLNQMAEQLRDLLEARQQLAAAEERNRLARDLHDSVKQQVFAATMTLGAAEALWERDPEAAREKVAEAQALVQASQKELKHLIYELRPIALEGRSLTDAIREQVDEWSRQNGIAAAFHIKGEQHGSLAVEQALFRVLQEALANVGKHSGAKNVTLSLIWGADAATLTVADDGCGFDCAAAQGRGMGLQSMRERVEALGGAFRVESSQGKGTLITARVPLHTA